MCGRYYMEDDTAREIEKVIRWVDGKLRAQQGLQETGAVWKEETAQEVKERVVHGAERESKERISQEAGQEQKAGIAQEQRMRSRDEERAGAQNPKASDIFPTTIAPVIGAGIETAGYRALECRMLRWGMPGYAPKANGKKGQVIFNARSETAMEKPTFREGIQSHRIVVPAAGFYEWNSKKEKYRFRRTDSPVLFMAGCFRHYEDGERFVILTTAANASMEPVHDRMPLILEPDEIADWIWDGERTKNLLEKQPCLLERTTDYEQMTLF